MYAQLSHYIRQRIEVTDEQMELILSYYHPLKTAKNEFLIKEGETSQRIFFVGNGCLRIFFITESGDEATRHIAFENVIATALVSFIAGTPSVEFVQALQPSDFLYIARKDFYHLLTIIPAWEKFYRAYLEYAYTVNTNRLMSFLTMDAASRYRLLLEQNPAIVQRLPNKVVASYLNMSQETLSRLKSKI